MIKLLIATVMLGLVASATDSEWAVYKATYGKTYGQNEVDTYRRQVWEDNLKTIRAHNELYAMGKSSYYLGENEYTDMTQDEFAKTMLMRTRLYAVNQTAKLEKSFLSRERLPPEVNWVKKGYVTPVKNQGNCGSCWAFSSTGSLEGAHFKATGRLVSLSESNLVDCTLTFGNKGCDGGWMDNAFQYVIQNKGIDTESSYPYVAKTGTCLFNPGTVGSTISSFKDIQSGSEEALQAASASVGPISVAIDAIGVPFQNYKGGVMDDKFCSSTLLNHAVLVVGYGTYKGKDYWLVKNSWGTSWGLEGYIMMSRNKNNQCGIATKASYPVF